MAKPTELTDLAPQTRTAEAAERILLSRLGDVRRGEHAARNIHSGAVHDMRVASRRLRAALHLFADGRQSKLERAVKRLQDALGVVRDLQIQLIWLGSTARHADAKAFAPLKRQLARQLRGGRATLQVELTKWRRRTAPSIARHAAAISRKGRLGGKPMRKRLSRRLLKLDHRVAAAGSLGPRRAHRLRIEVKRLRYEAELLRPAFRRPTRAILDLTVELQERLGVLHDLDVQIQLLSEYIGRSRTSPTESELKVLDALKAQRKRSSAKLSAYLASSRQALREIRRRF